MRASTLNEQERDNVRINLTGEIAVLVDGERVTIRGIKQLALLARLALDAGTTVSRDGLLHDLWAGRRLDSGTGALRVQVNRLRKTLDLAGATNLIVTEPTGYRLNLAPTAIDVFAAEAEANAANALHQTDPAAASQLFERAESNLSGRLLVGLEDFEFARAADAAFISMFATAQRRWALAMAESGDHGRAVALLDTLIATDPLDAGAVAQLMAAHRRSGRPHLALEVASRHRRAIASVGLFVSADVANEERRALDGEDSNEPIILVGRERECAAIGAALAALHQETGGVMVVTGNAGMGKTTLLDWVGDAAGQRSDVTVHRASGDRLEADLPLHLVRDLFRDVDGVAAAVTNALGTASAQVRRSSAPTSATEWARLAASNDLIDILRNHLAGPTLVMVDDMHWVDDSSLRVLRHLARLSTASPILLVVAGRPRAFGGWERRVVDQVTSRLHLEPLDADVALSLAESIVGEHLAPSSVEAVSGLDGVPMLVVDAATRLRAGLTVAPGPDPTIDGISRLDALADARLNGIDSIIAELCDATLVLGRHATIDNLARLLERRPLEVLRLVQSAAEVGLLKPSGSVVEFVHDTIAQAVRRRMSELARSVLHRTATKVLADAGAPITSIAAHAALAAAAPGDVDIVTWLRGAADQTSALEPETALSFLDRALELAADPDARFDIQRARVEALVSLDRVVEAIELLETVSGLVPERQPDLSVRLAGLQLLSNDALAAERTVALALEGETSGPVRARLLAVASMVAMSQLQCDQALASARAALELGSEEGDLPSQSIASGMLGRICSVGYDMAEGLKHAKMAVEYAEADATGESHTYQPWSMLAMSALDMDAHRDVERAVEQGLRRSRDFYTPWGEPIYEALRASLAYRRGHLDEVEQLCTTIAARHVDVGVGPADPWAYAFLSLVAARRGDTHEAARFAAAALEAEREASSPLGNDFVMIANAYSLAGAGDIDSAVDYLRGGWDLFDAIDVRTCLPVLASALTRLALAGGHFDALAGVAEECDRVAQVSGLVGYEALAMRVHGLIESDCSMLERAAQRYAETERHLDHADTLAELEVVMLGGPVNQLARLASSVS